MTRLTSLLLPLTILPFTVAVVGARPSVTLAQEARAERGRDRDGDRDDDDRRSNRRGDRRGGFSRGRGDRDNARRDDERDGRDRNEPADKSSAPAEATAPDSSSFHTHAQALIKKHDKDGNGFLKGDERSALGMYSKADTNGDDTITLEELRSHIATRSQAASSGSPGASAAPTPSQTREPSKPAATTDGKPSSNGSKSASTTDENSVDGLSSRKLTNGDRKFYRFKSGKDRAPSGLPSFFTRDANGDGQISMSEYASSWNDRTANIFRGLDLNGDGIITAKEGAKSK